MNQYPHLRFPCTAKKAGETLGISINCFKTHCKLLQIPVARTHGGKWLVDKKNFYAVRDYLYRRGY